jgi:hypothetical protein
MRPEWEYVKHIQYVRQKTEGQRLIGRWRCKLGVTMDLAGRRMGLDSLGTE